MQNGASFYYPGYLLNKGSQQDYGVGIAAGNEKTKVYFSFDYFKEKGLLNDDYSNRYTVRLNVDESLASNFKVGLQNQFTYYDQNIRSDGSFQLQIRYIHITILLDQTDHFEESW